MMKQGIIDFPLLMTLECHSCLTIQEILEMELDCCSVSKQCN